MGKFCDDYVKPDAGLEALLEVLADKGALVYSASKMNQRGLWMWTSGDRHLSTTEGFWASSGLNHAANKFPHGYKWPVGAAGPEFVGAVLSEPRDPVGSTKPLYLYQNVANPNRYETTTLEAIEMPGFNPIKVLGHVFATETDVPTEVIGVPLFVYTKAATGGGTFERVLQHAGWGASHPDYVRDDEPLGHAVAVE
jgi:hypothetical protein